MSFRLEKKILFQKNNLYLFNNWKKKNNVKEIYESRLINSIYFDNLNYDMMTDSLEGVVPRHKLRIRSYPNSANKKIYLEKKISSVEGRYKISKITHNSINMIKLGMQDKKYGKILPTNEVTYSRSYFLYKNFRLTLDYDIFYKKFGSSNAIIRDNLFVLELKSNDMECDFEKIDFNFNFSTTRFSKYCRSFNFLKYGYQKAKYEIF